MTPRRTPRTDRPPASRLSYPVYRLERRIRARLDEALTRYGVTTTAYMALSELRVASAHPPQEE
ncbi:hypothetical protein [Sphaerisporangium dianthi]|uniref:MarR family transcriptional regulator n=1 Tax=Sphaerisporangium dianthi TaxID=1436120 RepID=A0ABV9CL07_9ACTN